MELAKEREERMKVTGNILTRCCFRVLSFLSLGMVMFVSLDLGPNSQCQTGLPEPGRFLLRKLAGEHAQFTSVLFSAFT